MKCIMRFLPMVFLNQTMLQFHLDFMWICKLHLLFYLMFCSYQEESVAMFFHPTVTSIEQYTCMQLKHQLFCQKAAIHHLTVCSCIKKRWTTWNFALPSCQLLFLTTIKSKLCQMLIAIEIKPLYS